MEPIPAGEVRPWVKGTAPLCISLGPWAYTYATSLAPLTLLSSRGDVEGTAGEGHSVPMALPALSFTSVEMNGMRRKGEVALATERVVWAAGNSFPLGFPGLKCSTCCLALNLSVSCVPGSQSTPLSSKQTSVRYRWRMGASSWKQRGFSHGSEEGGSQSLLFQGP